MRSAVIVLAAIAAMGTVVVTPAGGDAPPPLRMNELQAVGTHNSFHLRASDPVASAALPYEHPALAVQLGREGVRQFELDFHYDAYRDRFAVYHEEYDRESNCPNVVLCLQQIAAWSREHPTHHPILVHLEPKDRGAPLLALYEALGLHDQLDVEVRAGLGDRLFTPDDLRGQRANVAEAIALDGWPTLDSVRGRVLVLLHEMGDHRAAYTQDAASLDGRAMFVEGALEGAYTPLTAVMSINNPTDPRLADAVRKGILVRTYPSATPQGTTDALASGAHFISTDWPHSSRNHPDGFVVRIPGGAPVRCNPISASPGCTPQALEDLRLHDPAPAD